MGEQFDILEHTADVGIRAYGRDLKEAFANAAAAMFSLITEPETIKEAVFRDVEVDAPDRESLLVGWLNELVYIFDVENILFKRFEIASLSETRIEARCYGEKVDKSRHELKTGIKSATYHMLKIEKNQNYSAQVLFDI